MASRFIPTSKACFMVSRVCRGQVLELAEMSATEQQAKKARGPRREIFFITSGKPRRWAVRNSIAISISLTRCF